MRTASAKGFSGFPLNAAMGALTGQNVVNIHVGHFLRRAGASGGAAGIAGVHEKLDAKERRLEAKGKPYSLAAIRKRRARLANESAVS